MITISKPLPVCYQTYGEVVSIPRKRPNSYEIPQDSIDRVLRSQAEMSKEAVLEGFRELRLAASERVERAETTTAKSLAGIYAIKVIADFKMGITTIDQAIGLLERS